MKIEQKEKSCLIELDRGEIALVLAKRDKRFFLQVEVDEYDDLCFTKRENKS